MSLMKYLVNIETSGNQSSIFATNKLRNVVGASELIYRAGTKYIDDVIFYSGLSEEDVEKVIATSGKALLLFNDRDKAKKFITGWSKIVTRDAPGIDAFAAFSEETIDMSKPLDKELEDSFMFVFEDVMKEFSKGKQNRPSSIARFQRIPFVAPCDFSGKPASARNDRGERISKAVEMQVGASEDEEIMKRLTKLFPKRNIVENNGIKKIEGCDWTAFIGKGLEKFENCDWIAVIHADGNGLGQLFINLDKHVKEYIAKTENGRIANGRDYVNCYRDFSNALDDISKESFKKTVESVFKGQEEAAVVPIVVGGDDLTVVIDGEKAIIFAEEFMKNFCEATAKNPKTRKILEAAGKERLGMCAGITITKSHFPFSEAYRLAEKLMENAKKVKKVFGPDSIAIDFHIMYDSTASSIDEVRDKLKREENGKKIVLTSKPYCIEQGKELGQDISTWEKVHCYEKFKQAAEALRTKGEGESFALPSSQSHAVRDDLFAEHLETQEAQWKFLMSTYPKFKEVWEKIFGESLYVKDKDKDSDVFYTFFLDAIEAMEFVSKEGKDDEKHSENNV